MAWIRIPSEVANFSLKNECFRVMLCCVAATEFHCVAINVVHLKFGCRVGIHCCHLEVIFLTLCMYTSFICTVATYMYIVIVELSPTHNSVISSNVHYVQKSFTSHKVLSTLLEYHPYLFPPTSIS